MRFFNCLEDYDQSKLLISIQNSLKFILSLFFMHLLDVSYNMFGLLSQEYYLDTNCLVSISLVNLKRFIIHLKKIH